MTYPKYDNKARPYACDVENCTYRAKNQQGIDVHKITHTDARPHKCEKCDVTYKRKSSLRRHNKSKHSEEANEE